MNSIGRTNIVFLSATVGPNKKLTLIKIVQKMAPYCDIHSFELIALYYCIIIALILLYYHYIIVGSDVLCF